MIFTQLVVMPSSAHRPGRPLANNALKILGACEVEQIDAAALEGLYPRIRSRVEGMTSASICFRRRRSRERSSVPFNQSEKELDSAIY